MAATKAEHRPTRAERRVCDRNVLARAKHGAGIVLRLYDAVADGHVFGTDEMKPIVVAVDTVVDIDTVQMDAFALNDANTVIGAIEQ